MTSKNSNSFKRVTVLSTITILLATVILFACNKNSSDTASVVSNMKEAATLWEGETIAGSLVSKSDENSVVLDLNDESKFVIIEKLPNSGPSSIQSMQAAEVITSRYGVIIQDVNSHTVLLLANNDAESKRKFESVKALFSDRAQSSIIFGTTIVNAGKA